LEELFRLEDRRPGNHRRSRKKQSGLKGSKSEKRPRKGRSNKMSCASRKQFGARITRIGLCVGNHRIGTSRKEMDTIHRHQNHGQDGATKADRARQESRKIWIAAWNGSRPREGLSSKQHTFALCPIRLFAAAGGQHNLRGKSPFPLMINFFMGLLPFAEVRFCRFPC
jgi:hypothetical protein